MLNNPNPTTSAEAAAEVKTFYTVNLYKNQIFVYQNNRVGKSNPITLGRKVGKYPQDQRHLDLINQLYPNARIHGSAA